jgi:hypothetical protein
MGNNRCNNGDKMLMFFEKRFGHNYKWFGWLDIGLFWKGVVDILLIAYRRGYRLSAV